MKQWKILTDMVNFIMIDAMVHNSSPILDVLKREISDTETRPRPPRLIMTKEIDGVMSIVEKQLGRQSSGL